MSRSTSPATVAKSSSISPWLNADYDNQFRYEIRSAIEDSDITGFKPQPPFVWIHKNNATARLYKALSKLAPLFAVIGYHGQVCSWVSPPPSGLGNVICIVMGRDAVGRVRLIGGNWFTTPRNQKSTQLSASEFFARYDKSEQRVQQEMVVNAVISSMTPEHFAIAREVELQCETFHTMHIYLTVLDGDAALFAVAPAIVDGVRPADFSYEFFGEIGL
jgi:hypothetical protein